MRAACWILFFFSSEDITALPSFGSSKLSVRIQEVGLSLTGNHRDSAFESLGAAPGIIITLSPEEQLKPDACKRISHVDEHIQEINNTLDYIPPLPTSGSPAVSFDD